ncbi:MAG: glycosyltransferase [Candidatus Altiarchaeales archaeon]|nr:glycosyltransferase [Candidatus Altiarchaeales archaeon]
MIEAAMWIIYFCSLYLAVFWLLVLVAGKKKTERKFSEWPLVSILVPAYNEGECVGECLNSLLQLDYPRQKLEIIAINDGSTDTTLKEMQKFSEQVKVIDLEENKGTKAVPLNEGLRQAKGEFVACLDSDSIVESDVLKKMLKSFTDEDIGAVTPALKVYKPESMVEKLQWFEYILAIFLRKLMSFIDSVYVTPGPFTLYRKKVLEEVGYFDEDNITEDMEMALRIQKHQYRIENVEDAYIHCYSPESLVNLYQQRRRWYEGLTANTFKYYDLFFNRSYGDFGILMPLNVVSVGVLLVSTGLFSYYFLEPLIRQVINLYLVEFDFMVFLKNMEFNMLLLDFDYTKIFVMGAVAVMGVLTLVLSHRMSREKILKHGFKPLLVFMMFYFSFLGYMWAGTLARMVFGRKKKW